MAEKGNVEDGMGVVGGMVLEKSMWRGMKHR